MTLLCSAASDVDPGNVAGSKSTEPAAANHNAAEQTVREQPVEQPAIVTAMEVADENLAQDGARESTPTRGDETAGTPPSSRAAEEEIRAPSPAPAEQERAPTLALAEASRMGGLPLPG